MPPLLAASLRVVAFPLEVIPQDFYNAHDFNYAKNWGDWIIDKCYCKFQDFADNYYFDDLFNQFHAVHLNLIITGSVIVVKKIISVATAFLMLCCMIPFAAFADVLDACPKCGERTYVTEADLEAPLTDALGFPVKYTVKHCSSCGYAYYEWLVFGIPGYQEFDKGGYGQFTDYLANWLHEKFGVGANGLIMSQGNKPGGVGRKDLGYVDENGTPSVSPQGQYVTTGTFRLGRYLTSSDNVKYYDYSYPYSVVNNDGSVFYSYNGSQLHLITSVKSGINLYGAFEADFPKGKKFYYIPAGEQVWFTRYGPNTAYAGGSAGKSDPTLVNSSQFTGTTTDEHAYLKYYSSAFYITFYANTDKTYDFSLTVPVYYYFVDENENPTSKSSIVINNNKWVGNIYTDNSTNLTYIYPQYTTINNAGDTITNISNNPIIYNNTTNQYYTYDTVTNNYYYITYGDTPATPTPSPSPTPDPDNPSVAPTPTPTPGGDTGDATGILAVLVEIRDNMIQGFLDIKAAFVAGFAELSAKFTLAIENLNVNIQNIFDKKFPDQSTPETALPTPSPSPAPLDPILPETQNLIIPKMNSNTFTDEHGTWVASGSSKYSDVFDYFRAFDRSTELWETNVSPSNLQIEIPDPENYYIDGYIMKVSKFTNRYAKEWTLQGSDDGETWNDLDTQKGQDLSDQTEHKYSLTLRKAYKYYRLNMSNYASSMCSLSHFNLLGYDAKDVVTPTPSPTDPPSPSPAPDPGTDPTPVPTPSGGTVPAPGGDSNISGGDDEGLFGWLWDLLKDLVKAILKAIFKILSNILGFLIWIVERVGLLLPFMPAPAIAALGAGVVLIFVIRIIRFIRG